MERKQIRDNLVRLLKAQIEDISVNETIEDEEPLENYGINSVAILKILVNIEKVFPISIDDDDFDERNFVTLNAMIEFVERKL